MAFFSLFCNYKKGKIRKTFKLCASAPGTNFMHGAKLFFFSCVPYSAFAPRRFFIMSPPKIMFFLSFDKFSYNFENKLMIKRKSLYVVCACSEGKHRKHQKQYGRKKTLTFLRVHSDVLKYCIKPPQPRLQGAISLHAMGPPQQRVENAGEAIF